MISLRNLFDRGRVDGVTNSRIRERCECELSILEKDERNVLKWFGHVERMWRKDWSRECTRQLW